VDTRSSKRSIAIRLTIILFSFLLTSCSPIDEPKGFWRKLWKFEVGPDYKPPNVTPVQEFRSEIGPRWRMHRSLIFPGGVSSRTRNSSS